ncbi:hypothetical protein [Blautia sp.]|uniref:hypothetical protein n=1 Tax=Blautia sp. TaxID=1955243 RepID=UPI0025BD8BF7|nr:hypothetical protein [Blautia sp.]
MDRHGNKEIKSMAAVLGCVMAGILLLSSVYLVYRYEERNRQHNWLCGIHGQKVSG